MVTVTPRLMYIPRMHFGFHNHLTDRNHIRSTVSDVISLSPISSPSPVPGLNSSGTSHPHHLQRGSPPTQTFQKKKHKNNPALVPALLVDSTVSTVGKRKSGRRTTRPHKPTNA